MKSALYLTLAGWSSFLAGVAGFLYSMAFVILQDALLSGLFLLIGGLGSIVA